MIRASDRRRGGRSVIDEARARLPFSRMPPLEGATNDPQPARQEWKMFSLLGEAAHLSARSENITFVTLGLCGNRTFARNPRPNSGFDCAGPTETRQLFFFLHYVWLVILRQTYALVDPVDGSKSR